MLSHKKLILCASILAICWLDLSASQQSQGYFAGIKRLFTQQSDAGQPDTQPSKVISPEKMAKAPQDVQKLIAQFVGQSKTEIEYEHIKTLPTPASLVAFHDDGKKLTSAGISGSNAVIITRAIAPYTERTTQQKINAGDIIKRFEQEAPGIRSNNLLLSGNGVRVVIGAHILNTITGQEIASIPDSLRIPRFNPLCIDHAGSILALGDFHSAPILWNIDHQQEINLPTTHQYGTGYFYTTPQFSYDGKTFACATTNNSIVLCDTETGTIQRTVATGIPIDDMSSRLNSLALHKNNQYLLYSGYIQTMLGGKSGIFLMNLMTGEKTVLSSKQDRNLLSAGFAADNSMYALYWRGKPKIEDPYSMTLFKLNEKQQTSEIQNIPFKGIRTLGGGIFIDRSPRIVFSPNYEFLAVAYEDGIQLFRNKNSLQAQIEKTKKVQEFQEKQKKEKTRSGYQTRADAIQDRLKYLKTLRPTGTTVPPFYKALQKGSLPLQRPQQPPSPISTEPSAPVVEDVD